MHPAVSLFAEKTLNNQHLLVPILFVALSTVANLYGPAQHSLLVTAASWALVCIPAVFRAGLWSSSSKNRRTTCWLAGGFLGLAAICERAANDKEGIWATRVWNYSIIYHIAIANGISQIVGIAAAAGCGPRRARRPSDAPRTAVL
jgi:hypothetical protein